MGLTATQLSHSLKNSIPNPSEKCPKDVRGNLNNLGDVS